MDAIARLTASEAAKPAADILALLIGSAILRRPIDIGKVIYHLPHRGGTFELTKLAQCRASEFVTELSPPTRTARTRLSILQVKT
jgi:hypothetical protein